MVAIDTVGASEKLKSLTPLNFGGVDGMICRTNGKVCKGRCPLRGGCMCSQKGQGRARPSPSDTALAFNMAVCRTYLEHRRE